MLCPDVEFSVQERCGPVRAHPKKGLKNYPRDVTCLLRGQAEIADAVQPGEEVVLGGHDSSLKIKGRKI